MARRGPVFVEIVLAKPQRKAGDGMILLSLFTIIAMFLVAQWLIIVLFSRSIHYYFLSGDDFSCDWAGKPSAKSLVSQIESLGYEYLGIFREDSILRFSVTSLTYVSGEHKTFASIAEIGGRLFYVFLTPFMGGEVLLTANGYFSKIQGKDCCVESLPGMSVSDLHAVHLKRMRIRKEQGWLPFVAYTQAARIEAAENFQRNPSVRAWMYRRTFISASVLLAPVCLFLVFPLKSNLEKFDFMQLSVRLSTTPTVLPVAASPIVSITSLPLRESAFPTTWPTQTRVQYTSPTATFDRLCVDSSFLSPDGRWRVDVVNHDCGQPSEPDEFLHRQIKLVPVNGGIEKLIAEQLFYCEVMDSGGLDGLFWAPGSQYFYYTDAGSNAFDGTDAPCREHPLLLYDVNNDESQQLGRMWVQSLMKNRLVFWVGRSLILWDLDEGELKRAPLIEPDVAVCQMVLSPGGDALAYLSSPCPSCLPIDFFLGGWYLSETESYSLVELSGYDNLSVNWQFPRQIGLKGSKGQDELELIYDLDTGTLKTVP